MLAEGGAFWRAEVELRHSRRSESPKSVFCDRGRKGWEHMFSCVPGTF